MGHLKKGAQSMFKLLPRKTRRGPGRAVESLWLAESKGDSLTEKGGGGRADRQKRRHRMGRGGGEGLGKMG